ncbi:tetratricopeptide repeat protein [Telmatobacter bradus]|uniref:O-linked N-acetylglucosamine transferase, SPINDLY family protein n=1 Tax=Telmatobacter bradus TaxID=474953 RepID=UPI003B430AD6
MTNREEPSIPALLAEAVQLHNSGQLAPAEAIYWRVLRLQPGNADALHLLGVMCYQIGRFDKALEFFDQALASQPRFAEALNNRGNALVALGRREEAIGLFEQAVAIKPEFAEAWINLGASQFELHQLEASVASYDEAIRMRPDSAQALNNRGNSLARMQRFEQALRDFDRAIELAPSWDAPHCNRASKLLEADRLPEALTGFDRALALNPKLVHARLGRALVRLMGKDFRGALEDAGAALALQPDLDFLPGLDAWTRQHLAVWPGLEPRRQAIRQLIEQGRMAATPLHLLAISGDPALQKRAAELCIAQKFPARDALPREASANRANGKIRVGYFSPDFGEHPVSRLMVELFERHDREHFEVFGFGWGKHAASPLRERVRAAFDHFIDVESLPESEVIAQARALELDVAVDLCGFTLHNRTGIFAARVAPVQVNYLGYPATMGAGYIDYLIADDVLIPAEQRQHYTEKIVSLPDCFQANDAQSRPAERSFTREEQGLLAASFVFCNFNNTSKITPEIFSVWMRILSRVPSSVLWLFADDPHTRQNLCREAEARGVAASRLIFAGMLGYEEHLKRQQLADLFLDTLPFNAGATASPALWAGLPVLTSPGEVFASRMCASLLHAVGLPELIAPSLTAYEDLAVELATVPGRIEAVKQKLAANLRTAPLFDTARFTRNIEAAYQQMVGHSGHLRWG